MFAQEVGESADERLLDVDRAIKTVEANRDVIVGVKIRQTDRLVGSLGDRPLRDAIRVAAATDLPVMLHIGNTPGTAGRPAGAAAPRRHRDALVPRGGPRWATRPG